MAKPVNQWSFLGPFKSMTDFLDSFMKNFQRATKRILIPHAWDSGMSYEEQGAGSPLSESTRAFR